MSMIMPLVETQEAIDDIDNAGQTVKGWKSRTLLNVECHM